MEKKISIIVPCYNVESYIERCFESIRNQTIGFEQIELILVNDASTDNTLEKLIALEAQYPDNIILINFEENLKQGAARNIALEYATAPYVGYIDSDDWVDITMFEKLVNAIETYNCDFVECYWDFATENHFEKPSYYMGEPGYLDLSNTEVKNEFISIQLGFTSMCNKVFKRTFLVDNDIFCPEQLRYEDVFFCYLAFIYANSYYHVGETLYHYFVNPNGTVQQRTKEYQFDKMKIALGFLETCQERGLTEKYKDAVEWMFLEKYYVYMIWEIFEVFPERAYSYYLEMKQTILELVPDYHTNSFRNMERNQADNVILKLLDYDLTEEQLLQLKDWLWKKLKQ